MGLLVVDEIFDSWERKKTPLDFHLIFPDWHEQDLRAMLRRDRNHPSVIMWSVGNEVGEQYTGEEGAAIAKRLHDIVREEDPTRPTTTAMNWAKPDMPLPAVAGCHQPELSGRRHSRHAGVRGHRSHPHAAAVPAFHEKFPDKVILSSESASALSSRGVYLFPVPKEVSAPVRDGRGGDSTTRSRQRYTNCTQSISALPRTRCSHRSIAIRLWPANSCGPAWDYLGEPTPYYTSRSSYSGIIDLAGFKKDRFYLYQSRWRPELPIAHILPHWTWPERVGEVTPVHVFTSGDEGELFINGKSQGRRKKAPFEYRLRWDDVMYEPGEVKVVAYKNGKKWATASDEDSECSPRSSRLTADRAKIRADGNDLSFVTVRVADTDGVTAPRADQSHQISRRRAGRDCRDRQRRSDELRVVSNRRSAMHSTDSAWSSCEAKPAARAR